jgi:hypothetical protein
MIQPIILLNSAELPVGRDCAKVYSKAAAHYIRPGQLEAFLNEAGQIPVAPDCGSRNAGRLCYIGAGAFV